MSLCPQGCAGTLLKPWLPFPLTKQWVGDISPLTNMGGHVGDTILGSGAFHAGSVPEYPVCHNEKLRFTSSSSQSKNTSQNMSSNLHFPTAYHTALSHEPYTEPTALIP